MSADISRNTFRPEKNYNSVRLQQGRIQIDADWNEQADIQNHIVRTLSLDAISPSGAPRAAPGFEITVQGDDLSVSPGRYYVEGALCENAHVLLYSRQPGFPKAPVPVQAGLCLAYLEVRDRTVTFLEDPAIREIALEGPDTATRRQTLWQVKLLPIAPPENRLQLEDPAHVPPEWSQLLAVRRGRLRASAQPGESAADPCGRGAQGGYRGGENRLYRVEIHRGGPAGVAAFKWSRDNASFAARLLRQTADLLTVDTAGRDELSGFQPDQWAEIIDERLELQGRSGTLIHILHVEGRNLRYDPGTVAHFDGPRAPESSALDIEADFDPATRKIRRWDMSVRGGQLYGAIPISVGAGAVELEHGVFVEFDPESDRQYQVGDAWMIPARTATRNVEWPCEGAEPQWREPETAAPRRCRLAFVNRTADAWDPQVTDVREFFDGLVYRRPRGAASSRFERIKDIPTGPDAMSPAEHEWYRTHDEDLLAGVESIQDALDRLYEIKVNRAGDVIHGPLEIKGDLIVKGGVFARADEPDAPTGAGGALQLGNNDSDSILVQGELRSLRSDDQLRVNDALRVTQNLIVDGVNPTSDAEYLAQFNGPGRFVIGDRFSIEANGNIGIGTEEPAAKLHITGEPGVDGILFPDGTLQTSASSGGGDSTPIGTIMAWHKSLAGTPVIPAGWLECNGQVVDDAASPYHGQTLPDLNNPKNPWNGKGSFLRGGAISGEFEDDTFQGHRHGTIGTYTTIGGDRSHGVPGVVNGAWGHTSNVVGDPSTGANGTPRTGAETAPVNMSVVWIIKVRQAIGDAVWKAVDPGISFIGGNVGIGTEEPAAKLHVVDGEIRIGGSAAPRLDLVGRHPLENHNFALSCAEAGNIVLLATANSHSSGTRVISLDVSNPQRPQLLGAYHSPGGAGEKIVIRGDRAFIAYNVSGLLILDISDPRNLRPIAVFPTAGWATDIAIKDDFAFIAAWTAGVQIVDISNPAAPVSVSVLATGGRTSRICLADNYAYIADDMAGGVRVVDISNAAQPRLLPVGRSPAPQTPRALVARGERLYVADMSGKLHILSLTNPEAPDYFEQISVVQANDLAIAGDRLFLADAADLVVYDLNAGSGLQEITRYITPGRAYGVSIGARGALYVANDTAGCSILTYQSGGATRLGANSSFSGNVGIGTEEPAAKLHITGEPGVDGILFPDGTLQTSASSGGGDSTPIGTIMAWHKSLAGTPEIPAGWLECNGQIVDDAASPYHGQTLPDLNNPKNPWNGKGSFLRGGAISGQFEDDTFQGHRHSHSGNVWSDNPSGWMSPTSGSVWINNGAFSIGGPVNDGTNGTPRTGAETAPVNMSVVWIIKVRHAIGDAVWKAVDPGISFIGGNVGIGTEEPAAKLHITGEPGVDGILFPDGTLQTSASSGGGDSTPIGTIMAWHKSLAGTPEIPAGWLECNGQIVDDAASPYHGQTLPDLNNPKNPWNGKGSFLRGGAISGEFEDDTFQGHHHSIFKDTRVFEWYENTPRGTHAPNPDDNHSHHLNTTASTYRAVDAEQDGLNGTPRTGAETAPVNMSVVWIIKVRHAIGDAVWTAVDSGIAFVGGNVGIGTDEPGADQLDVRGRAYASGGWQTSNADYAEYFESADGKAIPVATAVVLNSDGKIRKAKKGETPFGIISARPGYLGNVFKEWPGKYLHDDFGAPIFETVEVEIQRRNAAGALVGTGQFTKITQPRLNPAYDPALTYVPREERPEWNAVGLLGQLPLRKGQPAAATWIKLRSISSKADLWLVR